MAAPNIKILDSFEALHGEVRQQGVEPNASTQADVFCTLPWFENLARYGLAPETHHTAQCQLLLASDPATGRLVCLPLLSGKTLAGLSNYYSSLYGPLIWRTSTAPALAQDADLALWQAIFQRICQRIRQDKSNWPVITLSPLDAQAPFFAHMRAALAKAGYWVDSFFCFGNWYLQVASRPFATYFLSVPSALRHSIDRGQRKLTRHGAWSIHIQHTTGLQDPLLEAAIADFVNVYNQSWKAPEPNPHFIPHLARMAAAQGWLRLGILKLNGQAIAAQLWLVKDNKASIYKLAYVKGFERFSAGSVLTHALMQHVIDVDLVQEVDYLTGDDAYKRDWMSHRRERWGIVAFHPGTLNGLWQACKHFAGKRLIDLSVIHVAKAWIAALRSR